jgi:hypothetical protein|tara:strand:+ start:1621 stop:1851 length:231 start_codon:yes stop_codon:yes gene_type:complete
VLKQGNEKRKTTSIHQGLKSIAMHPISGHYHPVPLRIDFDCQLPFVLGGCKQNIKVQIQCKYKKKRKNIINKKEYQ